MVPSIVVKFYFYFSNMMVGKTGISFTVQDIGVCARNCTTANMKYLSFFFNTLDNTCVLFSGTVRDTDSSLVQKTGMRYFMTEAAMSCFNHPGYKYEGPGLCVKYVTSLKSRQAALDTCQADGASLVKIETQEENNFLKDSYASSGRVWVGGNDLAVEGTWVWTDGTPLQGFTDWRPIEPDGGSDQNCMYLVSHGWASGKCIDRTYPFLCEIDVG